MSLLDTFDKFLSTIKIRRMKKIQYNYLPAEGSAGAGADKRKSSQKQPSNKETSKPPTDEAVAKLNAIAREYPFCVNFKQRGTSIL
jgi:hypothetical protein